MGAEAEEDGRTGDPARGSADRQPSRGGGAPRAGARAGDTHRVALCPDRGVGWGPCPHPWTLDRFSPHPTPF